MCGSLFRCVTHRFVQVMPNRVSQRANGIIQNEQVLVLIFAKRKHKRLQDEVEVRNELRTGFLLKGSERRAGGLLYTLVSVQDSLQ